MALPNDKAERNDWEIAFPAGLRTQTKANGTRPGLKEWKPQDRPHLLGFYYSFRIMIAIGFFLAVMAVSLAAARQTICGKYHQQRWLLRADVLSSLGIYRN